MANNCLVFLHQHQITGTQFKIGKLNHDLSMMNRCDYLQNGRPNSWPGGNIELEIHRASAQTRNYFDRLTKATEKTKIKGCFLEQPSEKFGGNDRLSTAYGIRTRITTVKGWCPSP